MKNKETISQLDADTSFLYDGAAIVTEVRDTFNNKTDIGKLYKLGVGNTQVTLKQWGTDNQLPLRREELIEGNHIVPSLIDTRVKITLGQRLYAYRERLEQKKGVANMVEDEIEMPSEIEDFWAASDENKYFEQSAAQLFKQANVPTTFLMAKNAKIAKDKTSYVNALKAEEAKFLRLEAQNTEGVIPNAYFRGDAYQKGVRVNDFETKKIPLWRGADSTDTTKNFIYWTGDTLLRPDNYYFSPSWWGARGLVSLSNVVPQFHEANLKHGYTPRFHIRMRKGYFLDPRYHQANGAAEKQGFLDAESAKKKAWLAEVNQFLAGYLNTGRAIFTEEEVIKGFEKKYPDVEIIPLKVDLQDKALLDLFDKVNQGIISSMQMHPALADIIIADRLAGSGTEIRNALLKTRIIHTPKPRRIMLEPYYIAAKINGFDPKIKIGFKDEDIVGLAEDKTGSKGSDESKNPAS